MCGFFISNSTQISDSHEEVVEKYLRFRGPDCSSGLLTINRWKIYHSRLSIIDLTISTNQPMIDDCGGVLVFNGEILNFQELGLKYFDEKFSSDTKLLSKLISCEKLDLKELDGFFAFVYIDKMGKLLHAVRDSFGVKPLFYYEDNDGISFCSEPNVLNKIFNCEINDRAVDEYYATRAPIFSGSYFKGVMSINPGECYVNGTYFDCSKYLGRSYKNRSLDDLKNAICKGLQTRLVSDAPVGLLLSRGIDSNMLRCMGNFQRYYTIGFEGDEDLEYLKGENIPNLTLIQCTPQQYKNAFYYLRELRGEPLSVPNEVLLYLIAKEAASDGIKVLLSGEGADEFFGGYDRIFNWAHSSKSFCLDKFLNLYCYIPPKKNSKLYDEFDSLFKSKYFDSVFEAVRWFFIRYHMPILFRRLDFALMAAGVEGREPIANMHTFLESVYYSSNTLMGSELGKVPLREILAEYMGSSFAYEKKVGFPVDLTKIFENDNNLSSYELWFEENLKELKK